VHALNLPLGWEVLDLPALAETDERHVYNTPIGKRVFVRGEGQALQPQRMDVEELQRIRDSVGEMVWSAQYQQRPSPPGGGLVKREWLQTYEPDQAPQRYERIVQSWDTANTAKPGSDYSACSTWGVHQNKFYLLHVRRERLNYPDLKARMLQLAKTWSADEVVVEDRGSGVQLLQELPRMDFYKTRPFKPEADKITRMSNQTGVVAAGAVMIPKAAPWLPELLHELLMFPNGRHDDQVDSVSQALAFMTKPSSDGWMRRMREMVEEKHARQRLEEL
jgi:predicted phage terminase large subunit-like protein